MNIDRAILQIYASGHSCDESWYGNQPQPFAADHGFCDGGAFREFQVFLDSKVVGVAWPFEIIYTGGVNPFLWRPIPGVNAFNIPPYQVDLTPFVGMLTDGQPHTISVQVFNNGNRWQLDADLLLFLDHGAATTSGVLTLAQIDDTPTVTLDQNVNQNGALFDTQASRSLTLSGFVDTSRGRVTTTVHQEMSFANDQVLNLVNGLENLKQTETINTTTTTTDPSGTRVENTVDSFPLSLESAFQIPEMGSGKEFILPATVDQNFDRTTSTTLNGAPTFSSSLSDHVHASALLVRTLSTGANIAADGSTTEDYVLSDSTGACFNHSLHASQGFLRADTLRPNCP